MRPRPGERRASWGPFPPVCGAVRSDWSVEPEAGVRGLVAGSQYPGAEGESPQVGSRVAGLRPGTGPHSREQGPHASVRSHRRRRGDRPSEEEEEARRVSATFPRPSGAWQTRGGASSPGRCPALCLSASKPMPASSGQPSFLPRAPQTTWGAMPGSASPSSCTLLPPSRSPVPVPSPVLISGAVGGLSVWQAGELGAAGQRGPTSASLLSGDLNPPRKLPGWIRHRLRKMAVWGQLPVPPTPQNPDTGSIGRLGQRPGPAFLPTRFFGLSQPPTVVSPGLA